MDANDLKRQAAEAALAYVEGHEIIGVGAGTTVEHFIRAMGRADVRPRAAVAASDRTRVLLEAHGITPVGLARELLPLPVYVDGADEIDAERRLIKGGGGALTREKVLASASQLFVCIADEGKLVRTLGTFPLPVEVVPMALHLVERELALLGGEPRQREDYETDNANVIVDVHGFGFDDPLALELAINAIPGVVECGIFARRTADVVLLGTGRGVRILRP